MDILCPGQHRVNILAPRSQVATDTQSSAERSSDNCRPISEPDLSSELLISSMTRFCICPVRHDSPILIIAASARVRGQIRRTVHLLLITLLVSLVFVTLVINDWQLK